MPGEPEFRDWVSPDRFSEVTIGADLACDGHALSLLVISASHDRGRLSSRIPHPHQTGLGTNTFLGGCYRRIARRRGKKKAIVAVGCSILIIIWPHAVRRERPLPRPRS